MIKFLNDKQIKVSESFLKKISHSHNVDQLSIYNNINNVNNNNETVSNKSSF